MPTPRLWTSHNGFCKQVLGWISPSPSIMLAWESPFPAERGKILNLPNHNWFTNQGEVHPGSWDLTEHKLGQTESLFHLHESSFLTGPGVGQSSWLLGARLLPSASRVRWLKNPRWEGLAPFGTQSMSKPQLPRCGRKLTAFSNQVRGTKFHRTSIHNYHNHTT